VFEPAEVIELAMSVAQNMAMGKVIAMLGVPNPEFATHVHHESGEG
jgi:hypothetical protein